MNLLHGHCAARVFAEIIVYFVDLVKLVLLIWIDTKIILKRSIDHSSLTACDGWSPIRCYSNDRGLVVGIKCNFGTFHRLDIWQALIFEQKWTTPYLIGITLAMIDHLLHLNFRSRPTWRIHNDWKGSLSAPVFENCIRHHFWTGFNFEHTR